MGRFKVGDTKERKFAWGKVIFNDKYRITVETSTMTVIFHRFGAPRGHYGEAWSRFRQELMRRDFNNIYEVYRYANRFDITHFVKGVRLASRNDGGVQQNKTKKGV